MVNWFGLVTCVVSWLMVVDRGLPGYNTLHRLYLGDRNCWSYEPLQYSYHYSLLDRAEFILYGTCVVTIVFLTIIFNDKFPILCHPYSGQSTLPPSLLQLESILSPGQLSPGTPAVKRAEELYPVPKMSSSQLLHVGYIFFELGRTG